MDADADAPTILYFFVDDLAVLIHSAEQPDPRDWDNWSALMRARRATLRGLLVFTDGPHPSRRQQDQIDQEMADGIKEQIRVAIVTGSLAARGVLTALTWRKIHIQPFSAFKVGAAFDFLGVEHHRRARVVRLIARTRLCILGWSPEDADRAIGPDVDGNHFLITGTLPLVRARMLDDGRAAGKR